MSTDDILDGGDPVLATPPHAGALGASEKLHGVARGHDSDRVRRPAFRPGRVCICLHGQRRAGLRIRSQQLRRLGFVRGCPGHRPTLRVESVIVDTGGGPAVSGSSVTVEWTVINDYVGTTGDGLVVRPDLHFERRRAGRLSTRIWLR